MGRKAVDDPSLISLGHMQQGRAGPGAFERMLRRELFETHQPGLDCRMRLRGSNHGGRGIEGPDVVAQDPKGQRIPPSPRPRV